MVLKYMDGTYAFYEVKCYKDKMKTGLNTEYSRKFEAAASNMKSEIKDIGFVCLAGFETLEKGYVYIDGEKLYGAGQ